MIELLKQAALSTRDDVMAVLQYVIAENEIMRSKFEHRVPVTHEDKWKLQRFAKSVPKHLDTAFNIARPRTVRYWTNPKKYKKRTGRPMTAEALRALIIRLAEENRWGYKRIHGELIKLGLGRRASIETIRRILRQHGIPPDRRKMLRWREFRARHQTMWACDFFSVPIYSPRGRRDAYVLAYIHIPSRRIHVSAPTFHPNKEWVAQQARNWQMWAEDIGLEARGLVLDRDTKYGAAFREIVESKDWEYWKIPPRTPQCNGFAESLIGTFKRELLDYCLFESMDELDRAVKAFRDFYHQERPHRGLENGTPLKHNPCVAPEQFDAADIKLKDHYNGLLQSYHWPEKTAA